MDVRTRVTQKQVVRGGFKSFLVALGHYLRMQAATHSHEKSRSHTKAGPGRMRYGKARPAGSKLWRKACEGKL